MYQVSLFPWGKESLGGFLWELCNLAEFAARWVLGRTTPTLPPPEGLFPCFPDGQLPELPEVYRYVLLHCYI